MKLNPAQQQLMRLVAAAIAAQHLTQNPPQNQPLEENRPKRVVPLRLVKR